MSWDKNKFHEHFHTLPCCCKLRCRHYCKRCPVHHYTRAQLFARHLRSAVGRCRILFCYVQRQTVGAVCWEKMHLLLWEYFLSLLPAVWQDSFAIYILFTIKKGASWMLFLAKQGVFCVDIVHIVLKERESFFFLLGCCDKNHQTSWSHPVVIKPLYLAKIKLLQIPLCGCGFSRLQLDVMFCDGCDNVK